MPQRLLMFFFPKGQVDFFNLERLIHKLDSASLVYIYIYIFSFVCLDIFFLSSSCSGISFSVLLLRCVVAIGETDANENWLFNRNMVFPSEFQSFAMMKRYYVISGNHHVRILISFDGIFCLSGVMRACMRACKPIFHCLDRRIDRSSIILRNPMIEI